MLRYRDEAETEVDAITDYIILRFGPDVAARFDEALAEAGRLIVEYPNAHPSIGLGCLRILLANHPYQLVYRVEVDVIVIYAVAHLARAPAALLERPDRMMLRLSMPSLWTRR